MYEIKVKVNVYDHDDDMLPVSTTMYKGEVNLNDLRKFFHVLRDAAREMHIQCKVSEAIEYREGVDNE